MSVLRGVRKRKKSRVLGKVDVVRREEYEAMDLDTKVEMIRSLVPLGLMHVQMVLEQEIDALAGARYARQDGSSGTRYGSNPGTVRLAGQRLPIRVPRVRGPRGEMALRSYAALHGSGGEVDEALLRRVLYGISCRNYEVAAEAIPGAIGLSSSTVSRAFVDASAAKLKEFQDRDLRGEDVVALFLDGKTFADTTLVVAMGVRATGEKRFLGFVETDTEERGGADAVPALVAGARAGHLEGPAGRRGRSQGSEGGSSQGVQVTGARASLPVAQARGTSCATCRSGSKRAGAGGCSAPTTDRRTRRRERLCRRCTRSSSRRTALCPSTSFEIGSKP